MLIFGDVDDVDDVDNADNAGGAGDFVGDFVGVWNFVGDDDDDDDDDDARDVSDDGDDDDDDDDLSWVNSLSSCFPSSCKTQLSPSVPMSSSSSEFTVVNLFDFFLEPIFIMHGDGCLLYHGFIVYVYLSIACLFSYYI